MFTRCIGFAKLAIVALVLATVFSCGKKDKSPQDNQGFTQFVSAHTSGRVSTQTAILIELAQELTEIEPNTEIKENPFSFSPAVKGRAFYKTRRAIEFIPDERLRENTSYRVNLDLSKLFPKIGRQFRTFSFDLQTIEQDFSIRETFYQPIDNNQNQWNFMLVEVSVADALSDDEAQKIFSAEINGKTLPVRLVNSAGGLNFRFHVDSIERVLENRTLKLICDAKAVGSRKRVEKEVLIHALNPDVFAVVGAQNCDASQRCLRIIFTDPLGAQDLRGLVEIENFNDFTLKTDRNVVTVFSEGAFPEVISGRVDKNIRSFAGKRMEEDFNFTLDKLPEAPVVRLLHKGTILPNSGNLTLPFSAVNLRAVELRVIRIFEHNVLSFLRENSSDDSHSLRRSGRLVARKLLRLDQDRSKMLTDWNTFAVDLSALVAKEPNAIYRFEFVIRQEFSVYPCQNDESSGLSGELDENNFILTEADLAVWDTPHDYYTPIKWDYEKYDWRRRDDPCHATFYMVESNAVVSGNLFVTNVGVIAKKGDDSRIFVSAQDIRTTDPLVGAQVSVLNFQLAPIATGTTDRDGFVMLNARNNEAFIVEVRHGGQKGFLRVSDGNELSLSRFDVGGKAVRRGLKGFIYGERGIWRPGDEIFKTFILEDRQKTIPQGHPVTMEIFDAQGQFFRKLTQTVSVGNFYSFHFQTHEQSPTGLWRAVVSVGGARFERSFRVETIKPNRLKINVDFSTDIIEKFNQRIGIEARWLHGAVARELRTRVLMKLSSAATRFKGYEAFNFNNITAETFTYEDEIFSGYLDADGRTGFTANLPRAEAASGMLTATFITTVEESGGGESMVINSLPYSPFPAYVGLNTHQKDEHEIIATDTTHYFDVAMLDARGRPVPSGELIYRAYRLQWSWWLSESENRSNLSSVVNGNHVTPIIDQRVEIRNGRARIPFNVESKNWGRYLIYLKDPKGGHATGRQIYADDPRWGGRSRDTDPQGLTMLTFTTDKPSYNVGETVRITLGQGGAGRALVSLENGSRTVKQWWVQTQAGFPTNIQFEVTPDLTPNFYVHITKLQQHGQTFNDLPIRLYGVVPVTVTNPQGELTPIIEMPDALRSEKEFTVSIREQNRRNMVYTLAIVDEGLLDINNFKTPNPNAEFNVKEALGVKTFDRYNEIIGAFSGELRPLFSIGGGEDLSPVAEKSSQRFKPIVKFMGPFELKGGEIDRHKVLLPPYIGSVRVMVVAGNENNVYGNAQKAVPVQNPLMILTTLPRVLGPGEEVLMPVNVFVTDKNLTDVKISVEGGDLLELQESATKNLKFSGVGDDIVFFRMKTKRQTGKTRVSVTATSGRETSRETIDIEVRNPNPQLTVFDSYVVKAGETRNINYEFDEELPDMQVRMEYARIPSVNLSGSLQYLIGYPHGCAEQIVSRVFPQLFLHNFTNLSDAQKQEIQTHVNAVIQTLYTLQTSEGGIAYWSGSSQADDWATSYAGHFMAAAKEAGYHVSQTFINNWTRFQRRRINAWNGGNFSDDMLQTYRLYSLAAMGEPDLAAMNRLRERPNLSPVAVWQLASAYALSGRRDAARQLVNNRKTQADDYSAFNPHFGSRVRDEAIILEALILLDDMTQALTVARRISDFLNGNSHSTQTTAWALLSMARFADKSGTGDMSFTTTYMGKTDKTATKNPVVVQDLSPVKQSGSVQISNTGSGNIYVGRTKISTPFEDRSPAVNNNLRIEVIYEGMDGRTLDVRNLVQGTDFTATVRVTNTSATTTYTNLALTHIIPSGWEIFNTRLANDDNSGDSPDGITYQDIRDDRVLSYFDLEPRRTKSVSVRLQAAYLGRFFMPALLCYAMYDNTVYARTTGTWVEIVK